MVVQRANRRSQQFNPPSKETESENNYFHSYYINLIKKNMLISMYSIEQNTTVAIIGRRHTSITTVLPRNGKHIS